MSLAPVRPEMCATCPFRPGSKYAHLRTPLTASALSEASRICHSTGTNILGKKTGLPHRLCRGARDIQINYFYTIGFLSAPTDAAWAAKLAKMRKAKKVRRAK